MPAQIFWAPHTGVVDGGLAEHAGGLSGVRVELVALDHANAVFTPVGDVGHAERLSERDHFKAAGGVVGCRATHHTLLFWGVGLAFDFYGGVFCQPVGAGGHADGEVVGFEKFDVDGVEGSPVLHVCEGRRRI